MLKFLFVNFFGSQNPVQNQRYFACGSGSFPWNLAGPGPRVSLPPLNISGINRTAARE
jgi:hypothetical protein